MSQEGFIYNAYQFGFDAFQDRLARDLGITQKTAWFMTQRIREALDGEDRKLLAGIVEADEAYIGGLEKNKHNRKKLKAGKGAAGKAAHITTSAKNI